MTTAPKPQRYVDALAIQGLDQRIKDQTAELIRLRSVNAELVAALHSCAARLHQETDGDAWTLHAQARALLAKLGEQ